MADAFNTSTSPLGHDNSTGAGLVQSAYDRLVEFALRATPLIRDVADKKPARQAMPGAVVNLQIFKDLDKATTSLTEASDVTSVALGTPDIIPITLKEYGNSTVTTRALQLFSLADVDPAIANIIAYNMADSIDQVAQNELLKGTQVLYGGTRTTTSAVTATDTLTAAKVRKAVAKLRANKVAYRKGSMFWCGIHPEVSHDLRAETGGQNWRDPHTYANSQDAIWAGEIGSFEGAYFVESPRLFNDTDGASSARVYRTFVAGAQAFAEAVAEEPHVVVGPVVDRLMRLRPVGWYAVLGHSIYRDKALYRIETGSSIAS